MCQTKVNYDRKNGMNWKVFENGLPLFERAQTADFSDLLSYLNCFLVHICNHQSTFPVRINNINTRYFTFCELLVSVGQISQLTAIISISYNNQLVFVMERRCSYCEMASEILDVLKNLKFNPLNAELNPICRLLGIIRSLPYTPR
jgi:hypothetical protein